ncbi:hypothetical protein BGX21_010493 [Mortierella sp. AD011]|nr:hypothetical protein BGX20_008808 [Mortierella sp. AD010]KAF9394099.1 hypothetical protein BGX21_010493 [Mortierella sp. AD011]
MSSNTTHTPAATILLTPAIPTIPVPAIPAPAIPAIPSIPAIPVENSTSNIKKARKRAATTSADTNRPTFAISPSSLEYQLTANLLNYNPSTVAASSASSRPRQKPRRGTVGSDARIDSSKIVATSSQSTGHGHNRSRDKNVVEAGSEIYGRNNLQESEKRKPTGSLPSSPKATQDPLGYFSSSDENIERTTHSSPSTPHPPLPPKSPRSLIAHYFPGPLPPPPSRGRVPTGHKEPLIAPTPFKTPTFGPASVLTSFQDENAPPMPSPSSSFHYIPLANNISRCSTAQTHNHEDSDLVSSSRPSPCTSALGLSASGNRAQQQQLQTHRIPSDLDLVHNHPFDANNSNHPHHHTNDDENDDHPAESDEVAFSNPVPGTGTRRGPILTTATTTTAATTTATPPTAPIYPRGLMSTAGSPLVEQNNPIVARVQQKAVPYIRELVPGKEPTGPPSSNTSHDLEIIIDKITGRLRTNRTSMEPWPYSDSPWDEKPLPPVRPEKGNRYWVFRDVDGLVPGPFFFILGHLLPFLWWIGSVYPLTEHPDDIRALERAQAQAQAAAAGNDVDIESNQNVRNDGMIQRLKNQLKRIAGKKQEPIMIIEMARVSQDTDREGSTIAPPPNPNHHLLHHPNPTDLDNNISQAPPVGAHGPWSAEIHAPSLFEQRLEHDRKVLRYELNQRWKKINLIWSVGSFVIAIIATALVVSFA